MKVKAAQSCPTLWDLLDCIPVDGILQARILEWVAIPFSRGSSQPREGTQVSHIAGNNELLNGFNDEAAYEKAWKRLRLSRLHINSKS